MGRSVEIQVNGKTFKLGYGLEVFLNLGELWGLETLEEVNEQFQILLKFEEGKTQLKNMKTMSEIVEAMISGHPDNQEFLTAREIRTLDLAQFEAVMTQLIKGFSQNMPHQPAEDETEKKPKPREKSKNH